MNDKVWPITKGNVNIDGDVPKLHRFTSGLHSLDWSLSGEDGLRGIPLRGGIEIYGHWETGKSSLAYFLSGRVRPTGRIILVDLEGAARLDYLRSSVAQSGFNGTVYRIPFESGGVPRPHEDMLQEGADYLLEDDVGCVILDTAAMIQPLPERKGEMEEAFMGRRAQVLAKFMRRCISWINFVKEDKLVIVVNHMLQDMSGFGKTSPGGDTIKFGIFARLWISRAQTKLPFGAFEAEIVVDKLRFGGKQTDRKARVVIVPGVGVSTGLTAAFDCMTLKEARRQAGTGMVQFKKGDEWVDVLLMNDLVKEVMDGKDESFAPFYEILERELA